MTCTSFSEAPVASSLLGVLTGSISIFQTRFSEFRNSSPSPGYLVSEPWPHRPAGHSAVLSGNLNNCRFTSTGVWLFVWLLVGGIVFYGFGVSHSLSFAHPLHQGFAAFCSSHPGFGFVPLLSFLMVVGTLGTVGTSSCYSEIEPHGVYILNSECTLFELRADSDQSSSFIIIIIIPHASCVMCHASCVMTCWHPSMCFSHSNPKPHFRSELTQPQPHSYGFLRRLYYSFFITL